MLFSIILFIVSVFFCVLSIAIYKGRTDLIHYYHQTNVIDKSAYGKSMGKSLLVLSITLLISGIVNLLGKTNGIKLISVIILFVGLIIGFICIIKTQIKFNK